MYCPLKFNNIDLTIKKSITLDTIETFLRCEQDKCAWYCTYPNGEGECAIHSLPALFDGLEDIASQIINK